MYGGENPHISRWTNGGHAMGGRETACYQEWHYFYEKHQALARDRGKITIGAVVHGHGFYAAGLQCGLLGACDLIRRR